MRRNRSGTWPCLRLPLPSGELRYFPKLPVQIGRERLVPDALVSLQEHGQTRWLLLEIDEDGITNESRRRERLINLPTLRVSGTEVMRVDFVPWLLGRVRDVLKQAA